MTRDAARAPALHTISRHGQVPLPQSEFRPSAVRGNGEALLARTDSLREILSMIRELTHEVEHRGGDWREVVTFVRQLAPALWRRLPESEKKRFIRHLAAHWSSHRHRLPSQLAEHLADLRRSGRLRVNAGRIDGVTPVGRQLRVAWRPRGGDQGAAVSANPLTVDLIVNATGPDYVVQRSADPLMASLRDAGLISADPLHLGLRTAQFGACVDGRGRAHPNLYYLGPMLRADFWDATAALELRDHAERLAVHLAGVAGALSAKPAS